MLAFAFPFLLSLHQAAPDTQQLKGAQSLIAAMGGPKGKPKDPDAPSRRLAEGLKAFAATCEKLEPGEAAKQWLALFDQTEVASTSESAMGRSVNPSAAMQALPPPAAWPEIRKLIDARTAGLTDRHSVELRLLAQLLNHDLTAAETSFVDLLGVVKKSPNQSGHFDDVLGTYTSMAVGSGDRAFIARAVDRMTHALDQHTYVNADWDDLPQLVGEAKATEIYRKILKTDPKLLERVTSPTSSRIVKKLLIELAPSLSEPIWNFEGRLDTADLYPVFAKRWPAEPIDGEPSESQQARCLAKICYALTLELAGKHDEAVAQADGADWLTDRHADWPYAEVLQTAGMAKACYRLVIAVAAKHLNKIEWSGMLNVAGTCGHLPEALKLLRRYMGHAKLARDEAVELNRQYIDGLLACDQFDAAVDEIHRELKSLEEQVAGRAGDYQIYPLVRLSDYLVSIGRLTGRPDLVAEGLAARELHSLTRYVSRGLRAYAYLDTIRFEQGRYREIENDLVDGIAQSLKTYAERNGRQMGSFGGGGLPAMPTPYYSSSLLGLADLYWRLNRPKDILTLFQQSAGWGVEDLAGLDSHREGIDEEQSRANAAFYAAWALLKTGHKGLAAQIVGPDILRGSEFDPDYDVLLEASGSAALPTLDEACHRNPYVARPLMWKAVALHRAHRDKEAEVAIRSAIALDPCDARAPVGEWQKSYAVLGEIRAALGHATEAAALRKKAAVAKLVEQGDDFIDADLTTRAISAYHLAVNEWPSSALLQGRLGQLLESAGHLDSARIHYAIAFANLPDQLGIGDWTRLRLNGLFLQPEAAQVAGAEFAKRLKRNPRDAHAFYLRGLLESAREHVADATADFAAAADCDPNYLPAWTYLARDVRGSSLPSVLADNVLLRLFRLDPDRYFLGSESRATLDPAVVWKAAYAAPRRSLRAPTKLWRLEASARSIAVAGPADTFRYRGQDPIFDDPTDPRLAAAGAVGQMPLISNVISWLDNPGIDE